MCFKWNDGIDIQALDSEQAKFLHSRQATVMSRMHSILGTCFYSFPQKRAAAVPKQEEE